MKEPLPKTYDPSAVEGRLYEAWEKSEAFVPSPEGDPFSIVIPPPNVTGALHMGHALDNTLQDILIRYHRMNGKSALWIPGMDHAGIATQNVVEKDLAKQGLSRKDLGREKFVEKVWQWKEAYGGKIINQLKRLGASCDWSRQRFTMDEGLSKAVRHVFVSLYNEKLIYRSSYLIGWCSRCQTALSDLEVEHQEVTGQLTHFRYNLESGESITVATTRPETMLGDTAVAVHPEDARYKDLVGKTIRHPFTGDTFSVIADEHVDPKFGSGAVKITPAHDPNDYEMGLRHGLRMPTILDETGKIDLPGSKYHGLDRFKARKAIVEDLQAEGLFVKAEPHTHSVGHCQRCGTVVEPRISLQWFVKIASLAKPAIEAVRSGDTKFVPHNWSTTYLHWMENIKDWCISRQLWWGHRIPVWYCGDCKHETVAMDDPTTCEACGSKALVQDSDVLDTWFSSALWPFSTMGWPSETPELKKYYPTSVLVTGFDIIFFWVARMMMMGLKFMNEVPFGQVHIHALVLDEHGKKMTKSRGNVVDPLSLMDKYGTDALRFTLAIMAIQGRDLPLSEKRVEGYRNFVSKLWNAARFLQMSLEHPASNVQLSTADQWIESCLHETIGKVRIGIEEMKFNEAADALYHFVWHEYCDWYLEMQKETPNPKHALMIFSAILKLLHPFCPFVTEELWQKLPTEKGKLFLMLEPYPLKETFVYRHIEFDDDETMKPVTDVMNLKFAVEAIRHFRSENKILPSKKMRTRFVRSLDQETSLESSLHEHGGYLCALAGLSEVLPASDRSDFGKTSQIPLGDHLLLEVSWEGLVDQAAEVDRVKKLLEQAKKDILFLEERAKKYNEKTPVQLREKDAEKLRVARALVEKYERELASVQA